MLDLFPSFKFAEDQNYSMEMLYLHGILKGLQVGPLLGLVVGIPLAMYKKNIRILYNNISISTVLAPVATSVLIYNKMRNEPYIGYQDRAWRLQRNRNQNLVDYCSMAGACLGAVVIGRRVGFLPGFGLGSVAGMAVFASGNRIGMFEKYKTVE